MDVASNKGNIRLASWSARSAAALVIGTGFWFVGHSLAQSKTLLEEGAISADRVENHFAVQQAVTTTGSAVGYFILGGLGLAFAVTGRSAGLNWRHPLVLFCVLYAGWCATSLLWSTDPAQTVRKLAILGLMLAGAFGAAARFDLEDLIWVSLITLAGFVGIGLVAELAYGTFRPWRSDYRFAGTCHPNDQGLQCALLILTAAFVAWRDRDRPWLRRGLVITGLVGLALSKSRTTLVALIVATAIALVLRSRGVQRWFVLTSSLTVLCAAGIWSSFASVAAIDQTADVVAMGRRQNVDSLTGRLPLWSELWKAADDRPIAGYGFGAFWGSKNVLKYSKRFSWHIPHGHNAYLDLVLTVGLVGAFLYLAWMLAAGLVAAGRYERMGRPADLLVVCLVLFSLVHGVAESKFPGSGLAGFVLLAATAAISVRQCPASIELENSSRARRRSPYKFSPHSRLAPAISTTRRLVP